MTYITIFQQVVFPNDVDGKYFADWYQNMSEELHTFQKREEGTQTITIITETHREFEREEEE